MSSGDQGTQTWITCAADLRARVTEATWNTCFAASRPIVFDDVRLVLGVAHPIAKERIESRHLDVLNDVVYAHTGAKVAVSIEVLDGNATDSPFDAAGPFGPRPGLGVAEQRDLFSVESVQPDRYTFEEFVIGASNRFAHAAARAVAERPAKSYNPLFIYGGSGLGKTHLLQAISHYVALNYPTSRIRYVSTETFVTQFVDAIKSNSTGAFKRSYRDDCDVLLIDDIQFLEGKEGTQEEFFHTFNFLKESGRQIVMTSDRPPKAMTTLEDRLRSRFEWGLMVDIQPPDLETRVAILKMKAEYEGIDVPADVLNFIATHLKDNIRELEGALNRVCAFAGVTRVPVDIRVAEQILHDLVSGNEPRPVTAKAILTATAQMFGFSIDDLTGQSRRRPLVTARQIAMYAFRELTDFSYPMIGREFGDRDHTTVIHAVEKIQEQMKESRLIYDQVTELTKTIRTGANQS